MKFDNLSNDYSFLKNRGNDDIYSPGQAPFIDHGQVYGENLEFGGVKSLHEEPKPLMEYQPPIMGMDVMQSGVQDALGRPMFFQY